MEDQNIIDAIDQRSWTYAKSLIQSKQSKFPQQSYYIALNNYLLYSKGEVELAVNASIDLVKKFPNDLRTTNWLFKILFECGYEKDANLIYENIIKRFPNNCELAVLQWFHNGLKYDNLKCVQKATMALTKSNKSSSKYKYWAALSCQMLAETSSGNMVTLFLSLGWKLILELSPLSLQQLYVHLKLSPDPTAVVEAYDGPLDLDCTILYRDHLHSSENWSQLWQFSSDLLFNRDFNDFDSWKLYIKSGKLLNKDFVDLESCISSYKKSRNSLLALVELCHVYDNDKISHYIMEYYHSFKAKLCCFSDLRNYGRLTPELLETIKDSDLSEINESNLNRIVNNQKLRLHFGYIDDDYFQFNWKVYKTFLPLIKLKSPTDFYIGNDLVLINIIHDLNQDNSGTNVVKNIIILKRVIANDSLDFKTNLWLLKLLLIINCHTEMINIYEKLKIKMIQNDSLSHNIINNVSMVAPSKKNLDYLVYIYRFYLTCETDLQESLVKSFDNEVYNKIPNFLGFNTKLSRSLQYYQTFLECYRLTRVTGDKNYYGYFKNSLSRVTQQLLSGDVSDNRDYQILWNSLGFSKDFIDGFDMIKSSTDSGDINIMKMMYIKETILKETNNEVINDSIKQFNKLVQDTKLEGFESWLIKIYASVFRLKAGNVNEPELNSIKNYLQKNLKFTKLPQFVPELSFKGTFVSVSLILLAQDIEILTNNCGYSVNDIKSTNNNFRASLKNNSFKKDQLNQLQKAKNLINTMELPDIGDKGYNINLIVDELHDSIVNSSKI